MKRLRKLLCSLLVVSLLAPTSVFAGDGQGNRGGNMNIFKIYWKWLNKYFDFDGEFDAFGVIYMHAAVVISIIYLAVTLPSVCRDATSNIPKDVKPSVCEQINELSPKDKTEVEKYVEYLYKSEGKVL